MQGFTVPQSSISATQIGPVPAIPVAAGGPLVAPASLYPSYFHAGAAPYSSSVTASAHAAVAAATAAAHANPHFVPNTPLTAQPPQQPPLQQLLGCIRANQIKTLAQLFTGLQQYGINVEEQRLETFFVFVATQARTGGVASLAKVVSETTTHFGIVGREVRFTRKKARAVALDLKATISTIICDPAKRDKRRGTIIVNATCHACGVKCDEHRAGDPGGGTAANGTAGSSAAKKPCEKCRPPCQEVDKSANAIVCHWLKGAYKAATSEHVTTIHRANGSNAYRDLEVFDNSNWILLEKVFPVGVRELSPPAIAAWIDALDDGRQSQYHFIGLNNFEITLKKVLKKEESGTDKFPLLPAKEKKSAAPEDKKSRKPKQKRKAEVLEDDETEEEASTPSHAFSAPTSATAAAASASATPDFQNPQLQPYQYPPYAQQVQYHQHAAYFQSLATPPAFTGIPPEQRPPYLSLSSPPYGFAVPAMHAGLLPPPPLVPARQPLQLPRPPRPDPNEVKQIELKQRIAESNKKLEKLKLELRTEKGEEDRCLQSVKNWLTLPYSMEVFIKKTSEEAHRLKIKCEIIQTQIDAITKNGEEFTRQLNSLTPVVKPLSC